MVSQAVKINKAHSIVPVVRQTTRVFLGDIEMTEVKILVKPAAVVEAARQRNHVVD